MKIAGEIKIKINTFFFNIRNIKIAKGGPKGDPMEIPSVCNQIPLLKRNNWSLAQRHIASIKVYIVKITILYLYFELFLKILETSLSIVSSNGILVKRLSTS